MQTYFFISLIVAAICYVLAFINIASSIGGGGGFNKSTIYAHMGFMLFLSISSLSAVGFGIAWIVEYCNAH